MGRPQITLRIHESNPASQGLWLTNVFMVTRRQSGLKASIADTQVNDHRHVDELLGVDLVGERRQLGFSN
jgi:hypothetical protein